ncbi:MAG: SoxR reducing system RseC family protein [Spirochaetes bacterium]|nr:SoxR reducing system RseC family protein [Spirochaetota bacterium]
MITEEGIVKSLKGDRASVLIKKRPQCDSCGNSSSCGITGKAEEFEIDAVNPMYAKTGDRVIIQIESSPVVKVTAVVYLLPVVGLIGGIAAGRHIGKNFGLDMDLCSILTGLFLFALPFLIIKPFMSRLEKQKRYTPEITGILTGNGAGPGKDKSQC